ncbi:hypothetical protein B0H11DRAFT_2061911 [Mycena galericulata]|nr:hypothetical protein B0H11DRAFT_2061911 [Mycena galericulata]
MVHRPADSRLLANLLSQEKEYAKHLATFLDHSNASLASFTAYASASSPASAHLILAVAGSLAAADDALRHYAAAVDRWRDYLKGLKALEDEVGNIMRDREILVTRLIKASKPTVHNTHSSSSLPLSPSQSQSSLPFASGSSSANTKLAAAQNELQACEAHLATKEAALNVHRAALVREGLAGRCRALAECGQRWSEAGRAGAATAQGGVDLDAHSHAESHQRVLSDTNKPLPGVAGSDVSLAPSQSASQIDLVPDQHIYSDAGLPPPSSRDSSSNHNHRPPMSATSAMTLPAAHAMTDLAVPFLPFSQHILSRRITEEDLARAPYGEDGEGSSVAEEEEEPTGPLEVVENPRFATGTKAAGPSANAKAKGGLLKREPTGTLRREATYGGSTLSVPVKSSSGFFGSLRGLFGRRTGSDVGGRRRRGKARGDDDAESDEPDVRSEPPTPRPRVFSELGPRRGKGAPEEGARKAEEWVGGQLAQQQQQHGNADDKGWASDGGTGSTLVKRRKSKTKSKNDTVRSVGSSVQSDSTMDVLVVSPRQKRRASLGVTANGDAAAAALVPSVPTAKATTRTDRRASMPVHPVPRSPNEGASLMSIVEDVARANREGWAVHNSNGGSGNAGASASVSRSGSLVEVKAPRLDAPVPPRGRTVSTGAVIEGLPRAPGSIFSTPAIPSTFAGPEMLGGSQTSSPGSSLRRPAKSPLRSALRAPSSSPPPPAAPTIQPMVVKAPVPSLVPVPIPVPAPILNQVGNANGKGKGKAAEPATGYDSDDAASMSSYETGHETLDEEGEETEHEEDHGQPPPPPPHEYGNGITLHDSPVQGNNLIEDFGHGGSDLSASSASTQTGAAGPAVPRRRKSVRVSLQPTFSTTPPAIDEDDDDNGSLNAPWSERRQTTDMWEDSSEEDVEYQRAKKLLTRVARKEKKNR